jgi:hypothetical protein
MSYDTVNMVAVLGDSAWLQGHRVHTTTTAGSLYGGAGCRQVLASRLGGALTLVDGCWQGPFTRLQELHGGHSLDHRMLHTSTDHVAVRAWVCTDTAALGVSGIACRDKDIAGLRMVLTAQEVLGAQPVLVVCMHACSAHPPFPGKPSCSLACSSAQQLRVPLQTLSGHSAPSTHHVLCKDTIAAQLSAVYSSTVPWLPCVLEHGKRHKGRCGSMLLVIILQRSGQQRSTQRVASVCWASGRCVASCCCLAGCGTWRHATLHSVKPWTGQVIKHKV